MYLFSGCFDFLCEFTRIQKEKEFSLKLRSFWYVSSSFESGSDGFFLSLHAEFGSEFGARPPSAVAALVAEGVGRKFY